MRIESMIAQKPQGTKYTVPTFQSIVWKNCHGDDNDNDDDDDDDNDKVHCAHIAIHSQYGFGLTFDQHGF